MTGSATGREDAITRLLIKQEISDVMMRYCRGVNRLDMELVKSCYHEDAWEDHGARRTDAKSYVAALGPALKQQFVSTYHFVGNQYVEIDGSRAAHEAYFIGFHRLAPDDDGVEKDVIFGGRYLGVFESRNGGPWLIADRTVVHDWSRLDPVSEHWPNAAPFLKGRSDPKDLVFHLLTKKEPGRLE